ncbi:uncharacterized protein LOC134803380 isoform X2 [Cydia splendana]|uniref:uncharacterized protein LOC134803380 isoform X2 n=1 Tax=Cydia splendana TaxID=1100963 RepID=UPI00300D8CA0
MRLKIPASCSLSVSERTSSLLQAAIAITILPRFAQHFRNFLFQSTEIIVLFKFIFKGEFLIMMAFKMGLILPPFILLVFICADVMAKDSAEVTERIGETKQTFKVNTGAPLMFADELKQTLEKYLFGMCPSGYKMPKPKNATTVSCDLDSEQQDLAGRLAALALRAHSAGRGDCSRLGVALANTFGELARTAANRHALSQAATNEANKKRKLSKSQKAKIQAKQRTALAVKKKAAALAAAAAAKISA